MTEKYFESPRVPDLIDKTEKFDLSKFLEENNIDRNNPQMAKKIANFEKSLQNQKNITQSHLLNLLAFHGISASYNKIERRIMSHQEEKSGIELSQNIQNLENWVSIQNNNIEDSFALGFSDSQGFPQVAGKNDNDPHMQAREVSPKKLETISENEKIEANRLGQQIQMEFDELKRARMSQQQIEKFFQEKWIEVHLNVSEHIRDIPVISDVTWLGVRRKKKEKFIETKSGTLPLSDIISIKEIQGNIVAFKKRSSSTDLGLLLIKEDPINSFENFVKGISTRPAEVIELRSWIAGKGQYLHSEKKDVPAEGFKSVSPYREHDFQVFDLKVLDDDDFFVFRSWNALISIDFFWQYSHAYFINANAGYTDMEIQKHNIIQMERYQSYQDKERKYGRMLAEMSVPSDLQRQIPQRAKKKTPTNPNDYYQNGMRIQKSGNTKTVTGNGIYISQTGSDGKVIINWQEY